MAAVLEKNMAKKRPGRPPSGKPSNEGKPVRLDPGLAAMAKAIATSRGTTTGDYLADIIRPVIQRDYAALLRTFEKGGAE